MRKKEGKMIEKTVNIKKDMDQEQKQHMCKREWQHNLKWWNVWQ